MRQEDKKLLFEDLCARFPHKVKISKVIENFISNPHSIRSINTNNVIIEDGEFEDGTPDIDVWDIEDIKPYLFPLSSMTEEQKNQLKEIWDTDMNKALDYAISGEEGLSDLFQLSAAKKVINWFIKNHFDFQGLIPKELAIDATSLNIY